MKEMGIPGRNWENDLEAYGGLRRRSWALGGVRGKSCTLGGVGGRAYLGVQDALFTHTKLSKNK